MDAVSARYAFVDVETTGFSPTTCAVVEIGCVVVERGQVVATFETLVNPRQPIPPYATALHGITDEDVASKPSLAAIAPLMDCFCEGAIVVAHNAAFDISFLPFLARRPSLCSYRFAARVVPDAPNHKNQTLRAFFNVADPLLDGRGAHRALADAIVTRHVFFACLARYLRAGFPNDLKSLLTFAGTRPAPRFFPCHPELVEGPPRSRLPRWRFGVVSTSSPANYNKRSPQW